MLAQLSTRQRGALKIAFTALTLGGLYVALKGRSDLSWDSFLAAVARFKASAVVGVALLGAVQVLFMILRMWAVRPQGTPWKPIEFAVAVGHAANMFLPARAGEAMKVIWLGRITGKDAESLAGGAGWILADRIADLAAFLLMIATTGVLTLPQFHRSIPFSPWWLLVACLGAVVAAATVAKFSTRMSGNWRKWTDRLSLGVSGLTRPGPVALAVGCGVGAWAVEILALHLLCSSQGLSFNVAELFLVLVILNFAIAIPVSVGNVGTFEGSVAFALSLLDVPLATGVAIGTAHHLLQMFGIVGWALWALARKRLGSPDGAAS